MPKFETDAEMRTHWTAQAEKLIPPGSVVLSVRYDPDNAMIITLIDPQKKKTIGLVPLSDDEGNGPGAMHVQVHTPNEDKMKPGETEVHILPQMDYEFN